VQVSPAFKFKFEYLLAWFILLACLLFKRWFELVVIVEVGVAGVGEGIDLL
jgi:hypothetical protein